MGSIRQWLASIGLEQYATAFEREPIDAVSKHLEVLESVGFITRGDAAQGHL